MEKSEEEQIKIELQQLRIKLLKNDLVKIIFQEHQNTPPNKR